MKLMAVAIASVYGFFRDPLAASWHWEEVDYIKGQKTRRLRLGLSPFISPRIET